VASAAYRSGEKLTDERQGQTFDYHKSEVAYSEIFLPQNAPLEYADRSKLWNAVEKAEKQCNAVTAREWEVAIPNELNLEESKILISNFAKSLAEEGICIDCNIHWKNGNHHAHILGTTRPLKSDGSWGDKERKVYALDENGNKIPIIDESTGKQKIGARGRKMWKRQSIEVNNWNTKEKLTEWRERWANMVNSALEKARISERVDHRSNANRGLIDKPTIHEGYVARLIESEGGISERCELNRQIKGQNIRLHEILRELAAQQAELDKILQEEWDHDERLRKFLARRADFTRATGANADRIGIIESRERYAKDIAEQSQRIQSIIERRQREADEARREREEAERRKREADEAKRKERERIEAQRRDYSRVREPNRGFSR